MALNIDISDFDPIKIFLSAINLIKSVFVIKMNRLKQSSIKIKYKTEACLLAWINQ